MVDDVDARKARNQAQRVVLLRFGAAVLAAPAVLLAVLFGALTRNVLVALLVLLVVYGGLAFFLWSALRAFDGTFLASLGAAPADPHQHARLHNLAEGLGIAHGLPKPTLLVLSGPARNICTVPVAGAEPNQVAIVVTEGLVDVLSRIELEAILAQQLAHVRNGDTALASFVAGAASLPLLGPVLASRAGGSLDPHLEPLADLAAVGMTRYPPGLVSALEKLEGASTAIAGATPVTAHLWLADPLVASGATPGPNPAEPFIPHPPLADRIAMLREL